MALIKFGGGVTQMSGSIGGTTYARNRFGNYSRSRTKPVNPQSAYQGSVRGIFAELAERWSATLTATMRTAWNAYGNAVAMKNRLGEVTYMTGFNHYLRSNSIRFRQFSTYADAGPTVLSLPETDATLAVVCSVATQDLSVSFDVGLPWWADAGSRMIIEMGQPQLASRNFFNGPWKLAGPVAVGQPSPKSIPVAYTVALGQKIWIYARILRADGRLSEPFRASVVVTA